MNEDQNEILSRQKRYSPFYISSLNFKDSAFEKQEEERDQEEKSFQLRKNANFNNGLRWMDYLKKEPILSKTVTSLTEKNLSKPTQILLKESAEMLHKKKMRFLQDKYLESFLKRLF